MTPRSSLRRLGAILSFLLVTACGGGGGTTGSATTGTGTVNITLSDATSSTLSMFEVDVSGIVFERRGGGFVTVAPRTTRIDFAQMNGLDDLVATTSLPAGNYDRITMTLDFSAARVLISGLDVPATVRDPQGFAITGPIDVQVDFGADDRLVVGRGRNHLFAFDLDIDQSVGVDSAANVVTFAPVLTLDVDPTNDRPVGTYGVLRSVDTNFAVFDVDRIAADGTVLNAFQVITDASTIFQVNGVPWVGAVGLGQMVGALGQRVFVQGALDRARGRVLARFVEAGAGVLREDADFVVGHVVARTGGFGVDAVLTVRGRSFDALTGTRRYDTPITVDTTRGFTKVLRRGSPLAFGTDDINIGQAVVVFGDVSGTTANAVNGIVRMLPTTLRGSATSTVSQDVLTLDLTHIDRREIAQFDFTVAGQSEGNPNAFLVDVAGLQVTGITTGTRVAASSWLQAVGASGMDALAIELASRPSGRQLLLCEWLPASIGVLNNLPAGALGLDLTGSNVHFVRDHGNFTTLTASPVPSLVAASGNGHYRIVRNRQVASFRDFAAFRAEVLTRAATQAVVAVGGRGAFDPATQTLTATDATVILR